MALVNVTCATEASARLMLQDPAPDGMDIDRLYRATSYNRPSFPRDLTTVITIHSPLNGADERRRRGLSAPSGMR